MAEKRIRPRGDATMLLSRSLAQAVESAAAEVERRLPPRDESLDVKALRERLGYTQDEFASYFNVSVGTLRNWEQGRRAPHGPARVLLEVIARSPEAVAEAARALGGETRAATVSG
jgi:putative transcriptional regulator